MQNNTNISERVRQIIDFLNVSRNEFAKNLGYARSQAIYDIVNGKSSPSFDFFYKLLVSEYSEQFNIKWLITGKGDMIINSFNGNIIGNANAVGKDNSTEIKVSKRVGKKELDKVKSLENEIVLLKQILEDNRNQIKEKDNQINGLIKLLSK